MECSRGYPLYWCRQFFRNALHIANNDVKLHCRELATRRSHVGEEEMVWVWLRFIRRAGGSGVEPASCYQVVAGLIPLVLKCLLARYWNPKLLLMCCSATYMAATAISEWMYCMYVCITVSCFGQKHLLNAPSRYVGVVLAQSHCSWDTSWKCQSVTRQQTFLCSVKFSFNTGDYSSYVFPSTHWHIWSIHLSSVACWVRERDRRC